MRAELRLHHSREAYAAAEQALSKAPGSPGAEAAAGFADYRRGDLPAAETHFKTALKINPDYPEALKGLASVYTTISWFRSARGLREKAFLHAPADPELMVAHANTLKGAEHIAALEAALAQLDPASEEARNLRVHIANDRAVGERKLRRLVSPYENSSFRLVQLMDGPRVERGLGVELRLNQKRTVKLLLDTGASGIAVSPKVGRKSGTGGDQR